MNSKAPVETNRSHLSLALLLAGGWVVIQCVDPSIAHAADGWWNGNDPGPFAGGVIRRAYCDLASHIEGNFGGMLAAVAGVVGLAGAAFGQLSKLQSLIVSGIGAASITAGVSLYFGTFDCASPYTPGSNLERAFNNGLTTEGIPQATLDAALGIQRHTITSYAEQSEIREAEEAAITAAQAEEASSDPFDF